MYLHEMWFQFIVNFALSDSFSVVQFYNSSHACFLTAFLQEKEKTDKKEMSHVLFKESD